MSGNVPARVVAPDAPRWLVACLVAMLATLVGGLGAGPGGAAAAGPTGAGPTATATAAAVTAAADPIVLDETVTFFGRGYGHGVGMSQYGARGRALAGQDSTAILAHYYQGAKLGTIPVASPIRVLLLSKWRSTSKTPLVVYGRRTAWRIDGIKATFPVDSKLRLTPTTSATRTTWRIRVNAPSGKILYDGAKPASLVLRGATGSGVLELWPKPRAYDQYRGALRLITSSTAPTVTVVNELRLELYLAGVVPAEMPASWPAAALAAQAIAARSYAARLLRPGVSYYDVPDDSRSQVYRGALGERGVTNAIVKATAGQVLKSGSSIADTLFHSTGGAATEDNENVFNSASGAKVAGPLSYLRGSADRDANGVAYDAAAPYATWHTNEYPVAELSSWFAADPRTDVGTLTALDLDDRGVSGRLISVTLIGSEGTKKVSGNVFRTVFNDARPAGDPMLRSTLFATAPIP